MVTWLSDALLIVVSKSALVTVVLGFHANCIVAALLVLVLLFVMHAQAILAPRSNAVDRLGATRRGTFNMLRFVRACISAVSSKSADLINLAAPVLVVLVVMEAAVILSPSTNAVHGLAALFLGAINRAILKRASLSAQVGLGRHKVQPAPLVLVLFRSVFASAIRHPLALAIHRLAAARLGALLEVMFMRASIAVVQRNLSHLEQAAALILVICLLVVAFVILIPEANTVHRLGTSIGGALLEVVGVRAAVSIVLFRDRNQEVPALLVCMTLLVIHATAEVRKRSHAVHRLSTSVLSALNISIRIRTGIAIMSGRHKDTIRVALLVDVLNIVVLARCVQAKRTNAVHRLGTAIGCALLEGMCVRASITVVGHVGGDLVDPAAPVLVVVGVMEAVIILPPGTHAINRLAAFSSRAINFVVLVGASLAAQGSLSGDRVDTAALILVTIHNMLAAAVHTPIANTVDGLATARLGARLQAIFVSTSNAVMLCLLGHSVHAAAVVVVFNLVVLANVIISPSTNTVNRLGTLISRTLLKFVHVRASMAIVLSSSGNLVQPATFVAMRILVMGTGIVLGPSADTVNRLRARKRTLNVCISVSTRIPVVGSSTLNNVGAALLVRMLDIIVLASTIVTKCT